MKCFKLHLNCLFFDYFSVVIVRSGYCFNHTQASDLVRCVCKSIIGSMVEFGDVRVLQLTNVRLVRFSPYHRGNCTYRYLIDPSH